MKKLSIFLGLLILTACGTAPVEEPVEEPITEPAPQMQTFQGQGMRFDYPLDWQLDTESPQITVYNQEPLDGYGCTEPYGAVTFAWLTVPQGTDFEAWVTDPAQYDVGGSLGKWGGAMETKELPIVVDPQTNERGMLTAYIFENAGMETYCSMTATVIDWQPGMALLVYATVNPLVQEEIDQIVDSLRFEQAAYLKNPTEASIDLDWIGFYGVEEGEQKAFLEGACTEEKVADNTCLPSPLYISNPESTYETYQIAADVEVDLFTDPVGGETAPYTWAEFLEQWKAANTLENPVNQIFKVELENGQIKKLTQIYTP